MKKNGFTLIEILIVVAIIGLLATLGLVSFQTSLRRSRDARRIAEIKAMQNAAEQYFADNQEYPLSTTDCKTALVSYVQNLDFDDPRGVAYECDLVADGSSYCFSTLLESNEPTDGNSATNCSGLGGANDRFYIVRNLF